MNSIIAKIPVCPFSNLCTSQARKHSPYLQALMAQAALAREHHSKTLQPVAQAALAREHRPYLQALMARQNAKREHNNQIKQIMAHSSNECAIINSLNLKCSR